MTDAKPYSDDEGLREILLRIQKTRTGAGLLSAGDGVTVERVLAVLATLDERTRERDAERACNLANTEELHRADRLLGEVRADLSAALKREEGLRADLAQAIEDRNTEHHHCAALHAREAAARKEAEGRLAAVAEMLQPVLHPPNAYDPAMHLDVAAHITAAERRAIAEAITPRHPQESAPTTGVSDGPLPIGTRVCLAASAGEITAYDPHGNPSVRWPVGTEGTYRPDALASVCMAQTGALVAALDESQAALLGLLEECEGAEMLGEAESLTSSRPWRMADRQASANHGLLACVMGCHDWRAKDADGDDRCARCAAARRPAPPTPEVDHG